MKKLIYTMTAIIAFAISANAQVGVETTSVSGKAILDFPDIANGAILLPYVADAITTAGTEAGTIIYDAMDGGVKIYNGTQWTLLGTTPEDASNKVAHTLDNVPNAEGSVITDLPVPEQNTDVKGVLVLESKSRALALPKVAGVENLQAPKAGMICYDTTRNSLAIFNGEVWVLRN